MKDTSGLPGSWFAGGNVSLCVRESSVIVTFGGPDTVYVTAVVGWCSMQDNGWLHDKEWAGGCDEMGTPLSPKDIPLSTSVSAAFGDIRSVWDGEKQFNCCGR